MCRIFADAQRTTALHRKLVTNLRRLQESCCYNNNNNSTNAPATLSQASAGAASNKMPQQNGRSRRAAAAAREGAGVGVGAGGDESEDDFNEEIARCIVHLLGVKKSEPVGDRTVRFLGLFLHYASERDSRLLAERTGPSTSSSSAGGSAAAGAGVRGGQQHNNDYDIDALLAETPSTRLNSRILSQLLPLLEAKEKQVRFRATQLISCVVNAVDTIEDELFQALRLGLLKRLRDKESMVRVQAVLGLGRLAGNEAEGDDDGDDDDNDDDDDDNSADDDQTHGNDDDSDSDDSDSHRRRRSRRRRRGDKRNGSKGGGRGSKGGSGQQLLDWLLRVLQNDPSADVRRTLLLNLPLTPATLPFLLERARDADAALRRALYARLLPALGDFRYLSLSMREKLLRWGLRDRDDAVRKAAARLFRECWIEDCARGGGDCVTDTRCKLSICAFSSMPYSAAWSGRDPERIVSPFGS